MDGNTGKTPFDTVGNVYNNGGTVTSSGGNLYGPYFNVAWLVGKDISDASNNPGLTGLQNNGGPTQTQAELPGSPALQVGQLTGTGGATPPATDQRGYQRVVNSMIDIGAFENQSQLFTLTAPTSPQDVTANQAALINLGSFTYTGSVAAFVVTVNWGDGTPNLVFATTSTGALPAQSHTYTKAGTYYLTITITDIDSNFVETFPADSNVIDFAAATLTISPAALPAGTVGAIYIQQLSASGGNGSYTFTLANGSALPPGLALSSGGAIAGVPESAIGSPFSFTVDVSDTTGDTGSQTYTDVVIYPATLTISPTTLPNGTAGNSYLQLLTAAGGDGTYTFSVKSGTLPTGLTLSSTGLISGTATKVETFSFTVGVADSAGDTGSQAYSVTINPGAAYSITVVSGTTPQSAVVQTAFGTHLAVKVTDKFGNPIDDALVALARNNARNSS